MYNKSDIHHLWGHQELVQGEQKEQRLIGGHWKVRERRLILLNILVELSRGGIYHEREKISSMFYCIIVSDISLEGFMIYLISNIEAIGRM